MHGHASGRMTTQRPCPAGSPYAGVIPNTPKQSNRLSITSCAINGKHSLIPILPEPTGESESARAVYPQSYLTLYRLRHNHARPATGSGDGMALRARLKEQDPLLFQHFLSALAT